jgi:hypothetical protein
LAARRYYATRWLAEGLSAIGHPLFQVRPPLVEGTVRTKPIRRHRRCSG